MCGIKAMPVMTQHFFSILLQAMMNSVLLTSVAHSMSTQTEMMIMLDLSLVTSPVVASMS